MNLESKKIESRETAPTHNIVVVDFLRHGTTEYVENFTPEEKKKIMNGEFPLDLTPEGEEEVRKTAEEIVKKIDPKNEVVVLWSSPAWRAQGSEDIVRELLVEKGIEIYKDSAIPSMRNFDQHDEQFMNDLWEKIAPTGKSAEIMYSRDPEFQEKNEKFESQPEVRKRAERVFNWVRYLAEHAELKGKKLHIVGVSHFEFLNPIMEDIFEHKVEEGYSVKKGEDMTIQFDFDPSSKELVISADFRGEHKDGISFDKDRRKFFIKK